MTYGEELDILTRRLAALLATPPEPYDEGAVQAALSGRKALLGLMTAQLREVVPVDRSAGRTDFQGIVSHPVAALSACLRSYPRPDGDVAPSDLTASGQPTTVGRLWVQLGPAASQAQAAWQGVGERLDADQSWTVVADVAAMARALAHLDADLGNAGTTVAHEDLRSPVTTGQCLRLSVTASEVLSLARSGPFGGDPPQRRREALGIVLASEPGALVRGHQRLAELLVSSGPVKPEHVQQIAIALARSSIATAREANGQGLSGLAFVLKEQAEALSQAAQHGRRTAMASTGDPRPLAQASEIARTVGDGGLPVGVTPHAVASSVAEAVISLSRTVHRDLERSLWLVPDRSDRAQYAWRHWRSDLDKPALAERLDLSADAARRVKSFCPRYEPVTPLRPHQTLSNLGSSAREPQCIRRPSSPVLPRSR